MSCHTIGRGPWSIYSSRLTPKPYLGVGGETEFVKNYLAICAKAGLTNLSCSELRSGVVGGGYLRDTLYKQ